MSVITDEEIKAIEAAREERIKVSNERAARDLKLLLRVLIVLGVPDVALIDPKRDAFDLINLDHDICTDTVIEQRSGKVKGMTQLEDALRVVKTLSPDEKVALRNRIGR